jgi:NAD(P)-dependent dehydrogenase (short-subunit alcohol dehydrogenase family)
LLLKTRKGLELFSIKGKHIALSGATGVLGRNLSLYLAGQGAIVHLIGRNLVKLSNLHNQITKGGGGAFIHIADVCSESDFARLSKAMEKNHPHLDVLINMAGGNLQGAIVQEDQSITTLSIEASKEVMNLNYQGTLIPIKFLLPLLLKSSKPSIINVSSVAADKPLSKVMGYSGAKAAIENLTKWLSVELCHKHGEKIRVNAIAPGFFLSDQNRNLLVDTQGNLSLRGKKIIEHTPMGRFGDPADLHGAFHWLCSDASAFVSGTTIKVDGGFSAFAGV